MEASARAEGLIIRAASKEKLSQYSAAPVVVLGSTEPARVSIDQPLQLNWCNVPESPCHWRSFGSDHRLPLLLAKSMLAN